jgi:hypothetical protein
MASAPVGVTGLRPPSRAATRIAVPLALGLLVEQEDGREDNKARNQRQPRALLDLVSALDPVVADSHETRLALGDRRREDV